jgi:hypothetical protein
MALLGDHRKPQNYYLTSPEEGFVSVEFTLAGAWSNSKTLLLNIAF